MNLTLVAVVAIALFFDFTNGFHDTANSIATSVSTRALSPRDTVRATVGTARLTIDYSRPSRRGRTLVGDLLPYDEVWRTGANAATQLSTTAPIELGDIALPGDDDAEGDE